MSRQLTPLDITLKCPGIGKPLCPDLLPQDFEHSRRKVNAGDTPDMGLESKGNKAGAAAEIQDVPIVPVGWTVVIMFSATSRASF